MHVVVRKLLTMLRVCLSYCEGDEEGKAKIELTEVSKRKIGSKVEEIVFCAVVVVVIVVIGMGSINYDCGILGSERRTRVDIRDFGAASDAAQQ